MSRISEGGASWFDPSLSFHHEDHGEEDPILDFFSDNLCNTNIIVISLFLYFVLMVGSLTSRRRRLSTFLIGSLLLLTGFVLTFTLHDTDWYSGKIDHLYSTYSLLHPKVFVPGKLEVHFGLHGFVIFYSSPGEDEDYNGMRFSYDERFHWDISRPSEHLYETKIEGLKKGLPNGILVLLDYLSMNEGWAFSWGKRLTYAGYYGCNVLIWSWISYILSFILFIVTPRHGIQLLVLTGSLLIALSAIFSYNLPEMNKSKFCILIEGTKMPLRLGKSYYLILSTGILNFSSGLIMLTLLRFNYVKKISTYFEINFDTPWDNAKIKQESESARFVISPSSFRKSFREFKSFNAKIGRRFRLAETVILDTELINTSNHSSNNATDFKKVGTDKVLMENYDNETSTRL